MMLAWIRLIVGTILAALLCAQVIAMDITTEPGAPPTYLPSVQVTTGTGVIVELGQYLRGEQSKVRGGDCSLLVLVSVHCGVCKGWRPRWNRQYRAWTDTVGYPVPAAWLSAEPLAQLQLMLRDYHLDGVRPLAVMSKPVRSFRRLGVRGTPTSYLVDSAGYIVGGSVGAQLPPAGVVRDSCEA